jgi:glycosyltransferase involved in cell wall biosynthesis
MRIALIDPSLFTLPYDAALAGALRDEGHEVVLHGRPLHETDGDAGGMAIEPSFYRLSASRRAGALPRRLRAIAKGLEHGFCLSALARRLAADPPDAIHFQWLPLPALDARLMPRFRRIAPIILTVHDTEPYNGNPTARLQRLGFTASLRACDRLIVHTQQGVARLMAMGMAAGKIACLPHGPLADLPPAPAPEPADGQIEFVLFGKIKPYKGADLLLSAFAALPGAARARSRLRIVGQPYMDLAPLRAQAQSLGIADRLELEPRFVADAELPAIFAPGSVAVFPYREIEASGVLSIALAHGRPILASDLGNFAETIIDGVHGNLLRLNDSAAWSAAMLALIEDRTKLARFSANARALAAAQPGWRDIARLTVGIYQDAGRARPPSVHRRVTGAMQGAAS